MRRIFGGERDARGFCPRRIGWPKPDTIRCCMLSPRVLCVIHYINPNFIFMYGFSGFFVVTYTMLLPVWVYSVLWDDDNPCYLLALACASRTLDGDGGGLWFSADDSHAYDMRGKGGRYHDDIVCVHGCRTSSFRGDHRAMKTSIYLV